MPRLVMQGLDGRAAQVDTSTSTTLAAWFDEWLPRLVLPTIRVIGPCVWDDQHPMDWCGDARYLGELMVVNVGRGDLIKHPQTFATGKDLVYQLSVMDWVLRDASLRDQPRTGITHLARINPGGYGPCDVCSATVLAPCRTCLLCQSPWHFGDVCPDKAG